MIKVVSPYSTLSESEPNKIHIENSKWEINVIFPISYFTATQFIAFMLCASRSSTTWKIIPHSLMANPQHRWLVARMDFFIPSPSSSEHQVSDQWHHLGSWPDDPCFHQPDPWVRLGSRPQAPGFVRGTRRELLHPAVLKPHIYLCSVFTHYLPLVLKKTFPWQNNDIKISAT